MLSRVITFLLGLAAISGSSPANTTRPADAMVVATHGTGAAQLHAWPSAASISYGDLGPAQHGGSSSAEAALSVLPPTVSARLERRLFRRTMPRHGGTAQSSAPLLRFAYATRGGLYENRTASLAVARRGYRATGPPPADESQNPENSFVPRL